MKSVTIAQLRKDYEALSLLPVRRRFVLFDDSPSESGAAGERVCAVCPLLARALASSDVLREELASDARALVRRLTCENLARLAALPAYYAYGFLAGMDRPADPVPMLFAGCADYVLGVADAKAIVAEGLFPSEGSPLNHPTGDARR